jgi:hypothetical protein
VFVLFILVATSFGAFDWIPLPLRGQEYIGRSHPRLGDSSSLAYPFLFPQSG